MDLMDGEKQGCVEDKIYELLEKSCKDQIIEILQKTCNQSHYAVTLSFLVIAHHNPEIARYLICSPKRTLESLNNQALELQNHLLLSQNKGRCLRWSFKENLKIRIEHLPPAAVPNLRHEGPSIGGLRVEHINQLVVLRGKVARCKEINILETRKTFVCHKCKYRYEVNAKVEEGCSINYPLYCKSNVLGDEEQHCKSDKFHIVKEETQHTNYQEIRLQQEMSELKFGSLPKSITVILMDDLTDCCQTGEDIEVTGLVIHRWLRVKSRERCNTEIAILANKIISLRPRASSKHSEIGERSFFTEFWKNHQRSPLTGLSLIVESVCPRLEGLFGAKLALLLTLIGGVAQEEESKEESKKTRGDIHLLLVGDPGTGKSQLMKEAVRLGNRCVLTSGRGSTAAGLTATALKLDGAWHLEAGAMVWADGGICCIDEFDGIREADRAVIHEAMEQQTVSIAKAGMISTLNTRTSVFAAMNPKHCRFEYEKSLTENTGISGPLLSRFDIILLMPDKKAKERDESISCRILAEKKHSPLSVKNSNSQWTTENLKKYTQYVKTCLRPKFTDEAKEIISAYYVFVRRAQCRDASRTTVRLLESLIRISKANARLMSREVVTKMDAIISIIFAICSGHTSRIRDTQNCSHDIVNVDLRKEGFEQWYMRQESKILNILDLKFGFCDKEELELSNSFNFKF